MEQESWRKSLGENLAELRKQHRLTQSELGDKLNYTDKSVSKWERGEGVPDISVLIKLSRMYGVSVDGLLGISKPEAESQPRVRHPLLRQTAILLIMGGLMIALSFVVYVIITLAWPSFSRAWLTFIIALPCLFAAEGVWLIAWRRWVWAFGCLSALLWTLCVALNLALPQLHANILYTCGGIGQVAAIVIYGFYVLKKAR